MGSLNVQSPKGAWAVLDYLDNLETPVALALQEARFSEREFQAFWRAASKKGYRLFRTSGKPSLDRWGAWRPRGGAVWMVDKKLPVREGQGKTGEFSQIHFIHCCG